MTSGVFFVTFFFILIFVMNEIYKYKEVQNELTVLYSIFIKLLILCMWSLFVSIILANYRILVIFV